MFAFWWDWIFCVREICLGVFVVCEWGEIGVYVVGRFIGVVVIVVVLVMVADVFDCAASVPYWAALDLWCIVVEGLVVVVGGDVGVGGIRFVWVLECFL